MPVAELSTGYNYTYLELQTKLAEAFNPNDLCKQWVIDWLDENGYGKQALQVLSCGTKAVSLQCPNGHQKRVMMTCHKEYCTRCGDVDSLLHKRSKTRALDRLIWSDVLGYMVFTLPREISDLMPTKEQLGKIEKEAARIVQDNFSTPGCMVRTHLMGKEISRLHIHANVLFPITGTNGTGVVPPATLDNIRQHWTTFVNRTFNSNYRTTNVWYEFRLSHEKMRHTIKYVTRPIVTGTKFLSLSNEAKHWYLSLGGWHNIRWYGQLANCKYKEYLKSIEVTYIDHREEEIALAKKCPACGERFKYQGTIDVDEIPKSQFRQIEKGVWVDLEIYCALKNRGSP